MPFTPAHVAAVLPLVGRERPRWAVPSALVIGSMVPDVLYFVPISSDRELSHSWVGVLTLDLALGLGLVGLWHAVAAPVVRDLAALRVRTRTPVPSGLSARAWLLAVPCLVLGSLTHVVWDAFTHGDGWGVRLVPPLADPVTAGLPAYKVAQYLSGVLGVAVVLAYCARVLATSPPEHEAPGLATAGERRVALLTLVAVPLACALAFAVPAALSRTPTEVVLYIAVVRGVSGLGLAAAVVALWWHRRVAPRGTSKAPAATVLADRGADQAR